VREEDIRNPVAFQRYLELAADDARRICEESELVPVLCPVCEGDRRADELYRSGFTYVVCANCDTIYVSPRPSPSALARLYSDSDSSRYWVEHFFKPVAEARRALIFRPRAEFVVQEFGADLKGEHVADIGAGFGLFLRELRSVWPDGSFTAIEPSPEMAGICREAGFDVIESPVEDINERLGEFGLVTLFELFEHVYDPQSMLESIYRLVRPGGYVLMTTLSGIGFDIQTLWESSNSLCPPHHLNFASPFTVHQVFERAGFEIVSVETPGELDLDIVMNSLTKEDRLRFWRVVDSRVPKDGKAEFQAWIRKYRLSSHLRVIARRPAHPRVLAG
jgi:SAM-dependent methyltransferase